MTLKCEGSCKKHIGKVKQVKVTDPRLNKDWGEFRYCEAAIETDRQDGFVVIVQKVIVQKLKGLFTSIRSDWKTPKDLYKVNGLSAGLGGMMEYCEYCTEDVEFVGPGTSFHGPYCEGCLKISLAEDRAALKAVREKRRLARAVS